MKTRLLFWLLLMGGVGTMTLHSTRDTSAGVWIADSKCMSWDCANKSGTPTVYYVGYGFDPSTGQEIVIPDCDITGTSSIITCMGPYVGISCYAVTPNSECPGVSVNLSPNVPCKVRFNNCSGSFIPPGG